MFDFDFSSVQRSCPSVECLEVHLRNNVCPKQRHMGLLVSGCLPGWPFGGMGSCEKRFVKPHDTVPKNHYSCHFFSDRRLRLQPTPATTTGPSVPAPSHHNALTQHNHPAADQQHTTCRLNTAGLNLQAYTSCHQGLQPCLWRGAQRMMSSTRRIISAASVALSNTCSPTRRCIGADDSVQRERRGQFEW